MTQEEFNADFIQRIKEAPDAKMKKLAQATRRMTLCTIERGKALQKYREEFLRGMKEMGTTRCPTE
jgi:hypothetical protein